jgi:4-alpha-glucanotransferase
MQFKLLGKRRAGILAHLTSLPGPHGHGDLGPSAFAFVDFLAAAGQSAWQMLPVSPPGYGASPYDSPSTNAGSQWLVSLEGLRRDGLLTESELRAPESFRRPAASLSESQAFREKRLRQAHARFLRGHARAPRALEQFRRAQRWWLDDHCLFLASKHAAGGAHWNEWDAPRRKHDARELSRVRADFAGEMAFHEWVQFVFDAQWRALAAHCQRQGVALLGDVPMFVAHDGVDTWAHQNLFRLDKQGRKLVSAGVPPDAFSDSGQLWGNPVYDWKAMQRDQFGWWVARFRRCLDMFDVVRLDHFIGFRRCFEIPADALDARHGRFVRVPGEALFERVQRELGGLPFLAEDLGIVTAEVVALRQQLQLPGMRVLQFAFGDPNGSDYLPHRYARDTVVYTGTHDNDTAVGWYRCLGRSVAGRAEKKRLHAYLGDSREPLHLQLVRLAYASVADLAMIPLQDALGLGQKARMNVPGTSSGNWDWRFDQRDMNRTLATRLRALAASYERI